MRPITNSILTFVLLGIGIFTSTHIAILLGRNKTTNERYLRWAHRIGGYIFFALYLFICVIMFQKSGEFGVLPPMAAIHAYIGIAIFPLVIIKICIVRLYKKFYKNLPIYGIMIVFAAYLQVPLHAGFSVISAFKSQYAAILEKGRLVWADVNIGRRIVQQKCSTCHSLERVYAYVKTEADWRDYVSRMRAKDPAIMNDQEAVDALGYLVKNLGIDATKMDIQVGMRIILQKCHTCHTLERVFNARKTPAEWTKTIELMRSFDPVLLNDSEASQVNYYLSKVLAKQDVAPNGLK